VRFLGTEMKVVIVSGLVLTIAASLMIVDFGRRVVECREAHQTVSDRLAELKKHYWFFKREP
jgi:hypothetical protein